MVGILHRSCDVHGRGWWWEYVLGCILCIIVMDMFLLLGQIWGYLYLQRYLSFVIFVYLNYICEIIQVYLVTGLSFQCVVFRTLVDYAICVSYFENMLSVF
jgi:hypothetical protein